VLAQDLIRMIFENLDLICLRSMWKSGVSAHADMIEIFI
jgi:hypothetical protein